MGKNTLSCNYNCMEKYIIGILVTLAGSFITWLVTTTKNSDKKGATTDVTMKEFDKEIQSLKSVTADLVNATSNQKVIEHILNEQASDIKELKEDNKAFRDSFTPLLSTNNKVIEALTVAINKATVSNNRLSNVLEKLESNSR